MKFLRISKKRLLVAILLCMTGAFIMPGLADALCVLQPEAGEWVDSTGNHSVAELNITIGCADQRLCPVGGECYYVGGGINMSAFGHCTPTNCDWGEVDAEQYEDWIYAVYDFGWQTKTVYAKMSTYYPDKLYVAIYNDYHDARADRWITGYLIPRQQSCIDSCGSRAPSGDCWCDAACSSYGDCCEDKADQCGP